MLSFALKTVLFFTPLLVILAITEYRAGSLTSDFAVKREKLESNLESAEVIVAGSSHAYYGIKPLMLGVPTVSIAYPGQDFYYDSQILLKNLSRAPHVKLVLINVSYFSFEYMLDDSEGQAQTNFYKKYWDIPRRSGKPALADYSHLALFGLQKSRDFLLTGAQPRSEKIDKSGGNEDLRDTDRFNVLNGQIAVKRHESGMKRKYIEQNYEYLSSLLDYLKQRNIRAVFILTPCYSSYYNNLNEGKYSTIQDNINTLTQKYDASYYNYLMDERFVADDFADSDHLNTQGAEKFTAIIRDEVIAKNINAGE